MKNIIFIFILLSLSGCISVKKRIPAKNLKIKLIQVSFPCVTPVLHPHRQTFVAISDAVLSKKGIRSENIAPFVCPNADDVNFTVSGFSFDGLADLDAYIQYLHKR